jgi:hypothetical protein
MSDYPPEECTPVRLEIDIMAGEFILGTFEVEHDDKRYLQFTECINGQRTAHLNRQQARQFIDLLEILYNSMEEDNNVN